MVPESADSTVYALDDTNSGSTAWIVSAGSAVSGSPTAVSGSVLVGDDSGDLHLVDGDIGYIEDTATFNRTQTCVSVAGGAAFAYTWSGTVHKLSAWIR